MRPLANDCVHILRDVFDGHVRVAWVDIGMVVEGPQCRRLVRVDDPARHPLAVGVDGVVGARPDPSPAALQVRVGAEVAVQRRLPPVEAGVGPQALWGTTVTVGSVTSVTWFLLLCLTCNPPLNLLRGDMWC